MTFESHFCAQFQLFKIYIPLTGTELLALNRKIFYNTPQLLRCSK
ncbi:hypothetical protein T07_12350 [Trichinella nelsoni]|uniref:Uncharacterized protein n=1 Tax=Trichinella nelsoni TaxID=6336 RepID=A0A0V0RA94_9BILA|nr:hypothetical protein T07_12350 [Trichinella nelsoni]